MGNGRRRIDPSPGNLGRVHQFREIRHDRDHHPDGAAVRLRVLKVASVTEARPPLPPFTPETAARKVRLAEDAWNSRDPARVALAYTAQSRWRNRSEFLQGRPAIIAFLTRKWAEESEYRVVKAVWVC